MSALLPAGQKSHEKMGLSAVETAPKRVVYYWFLGGTGARNSPILY